MNIVKLTPEIRSRIEATDGTVHTLVNPFAVNKLIFVNQTYVYILLASAIIGAQQNENGRWNIETLYTDKDGEEISMSDWFATILLNHLIEMVWFATPSNYAIREATVSILCPNCTSDHKVFRSCEGITAIITTEEMLSEPFGACTKCEYTYSLRNGTVDSAGTAPLRCKSTCWTDGNAPADKPEDYVIGSRVLTELFLAFVNTLG